MRQKVNWFVTQASKQGLRTLLMGMKVVEEDEKEAFIQECLEAESDLVNRESNLEQVYDKFERNIVILGSTAVEDKLQDEVP